MPQKRQDDRADHSARSAVTDPMDQPMTDELFDPADPRYEALNTFSGPVLPRQLPNGKWTMDWTTSEYWGMFDLPEDRPYD